MATSRARMSSRSSATTRQSSKSSSLVRFAGLSSIFLGQFMPTTAIMLSSPSSNASAGAHQPFFIKADDPLLNNPRCDEHMKAEYEAKDREIEERLQKLQAAAASPASQRLRGQQKTTLEHASTNATNFAVSHNSTGEAGSQVGSAQVFFLFMTLSGLDRPELWQAFFQGANPTQYRVLMHCRFPGMCNFELSTHNPMGIMVVETVPTYYCTDLVSGMVQLLRSALPLSGNPNDKFVFLSESTLPMKPFPFIYQSLTADQNSDFCVFPSEWWVRMYEKSGQRGRLVKHHQWMVLSREHGQILSDRWVGDNQLQTSQYWSVPVCEGDCVSSIGQAQMGLMPRSIVKECTDEWAPFAMIYGILMDHGQQTQNIPGLSQTPFWIHGFTTQGQCRTFAWWASHRHESDTLVAEIFRDPGSRLSCFPCTGSHPVEFLWLSESSIMRLRQSSFLFARKFADGVLSYDQFQRLILV